MNKSVRLGTIRVKVNIRMVLVMISVVMLMKIDSIKYIFPHGSLIYHMAIPFFLVYCVLFLARPKKSPVVFCVCCLFGTYVIVTALTAPHNLFSAFHSIIPPLGIALLTELEMKKDPFLFLKYLNYLFIFLMLLDLISIILKPDGLYVSNLYTENWFLGYKSARVRAVMLPAITVAAILDIHNNQLLGKLYYFVSMLAVACTLLSHGAGGVVCVILEILLIWYIVNPKKKKTMKRRTKLLNIKVFTLSFLIVNWFVVIYQGFAKIEFIRYLLVDVMNKDITISSRTYIWSASQQLFQQSKLYGYGFISGDVYAQYTQVYGGTQPHNLLLAVLVYTGLIGLVFFVLAYAFVFIQKKNRNVFASICIIAIMTNLVFGIISMNFFAQFHYSMLIMCYHFLNYEDSAIAAENSSDLSIGESVKLSDP